MNCDCLICENHEYEGENTMNLERTRQYIGKDKSFLDRRRNILTLYNFCPFCGKKINWKEIKKTI